VDWVRWDSDPIYLSSSYWDWRPPWVRPLRPGNIRWMARLVDPPMPEVISLGLAKSHLSVTYDEDNEYISTVALPAGRERVEMDAGIAIGTQTWELWLDRFPRPDRVEAWPWVGHPYGAIVIPIHPVQTIDKISWYDQSNVAHELVDTTYYLDNASRPARVLPINRGDWWPDLSSVRDMAAVKVEMTVGWPDLQHTPALAIQVVLMMMGTFFNNRETLASGTRGNPLPIPDACQWMISKLGPVMVG
jgi:uncharacterized phiE125 gp8 family phage protein